MIGRNWLYPDFPAEDDYFLSDFIQRALPEEDIRSDETDQAEDFLSLFIDHADSSSLTSPSDEDRISYGDVEILQSKFFSSFSEFDYSSSFGMIRLTMVKVSTSSMRIYMPNATLICYTLGGEGDVHSNGKTVHCRKYDCVCVDCRQQPNFRAYPGAPWECAFIRVNGAFDSQLFPGLCAYLRENGLAFLTFGAGARFRSIIWDLFGTRESGSLESPPLYNSLLLALFLELDMAVTLAARKPAIIPDVIIGLQNYLDKNYSQDINLDLLARTFSISKYHMAREFKRFIGKSPIDYLIDVRINRAKALLYDSSRPISDICQLVGIPNPNHFLYLFKDREGVTPSAFRKFKL